MSVIFDAMLIFDIPDEDGMRDLNRRLHIADTARHQTFNAIDMDHAGGSKVFTTRVYAAAFNHFNPSEVEQCICETEWRYPHLVMYICELGDYHYDEDSSLTAQTVERLRERT